MQTCSLCKQRTDLLSPAPAHLHPQLAQQGLTEAVQLCHSCLTRERDRLISTLMGKEQEEMTQLEQEVVSSILEHQTLSENLALEDDQSTSWPDRLSDQIAKFGGSWAFIISFALFLSVWIVLNSLVWIWHPFDPFPFILLNLALSALAALQAPLIMMSQNRQEARDRIRSEHDFQINLKAELEIRQLHMKMDQMLFHQWQRMYQIQELQTEMLTEILEKARGRTQT